MEIEGRNRTLALLTVFAERVNLPLCTDLFLDRHLSFISQVNAYYMEVRAYYVVLKDQL